MNVGDDGACAKVDLGSLGWRVIEEDCGWGGFLVAQDEAFYGIIAACEPITLNQSLMAGSGLNPHSIHVRMSSTIGVLQGTAKDAGSVETG